MIRKIINSKWGPFCIIFPVVFIPTFMLAMRQNDLKMERRVEVKLRQHKEEVKAEVLRRQLEKGKSDTSSRTELADSRFPGIPHDELTPEQARKHAEWHARKRELSQMMSEGGKKLLAQVDALLKPKKERLPAILSVFPMLSPEQLKYARENALKTMSAEDVEFLFNALAELSTTKTAEQVAEEVKGIITFREADDIIDWELDVAFEQYEQGMIELYGAEEYERQLEEARKRNEETDRQK